MGPKEQNQALKPTPIIESDNEKVVEKACEVSASCDNYVEKTRRIFEFARDEIVYNFAPDVDSKEILKASHTLRIGNGFCIQKAVLFAALCRAAGIPAKIGFQHIRSHKIVGKILDFRGSNEFEYHGLNSVYLKGKWIKLDCTLDKKLSEKKGYKLVEFDPEEDSLFPEYDLAGRPHFDILKEHGFFCDIPQKIIKIMLDHFEKINQKAWKDLIFKTDECY